MSLFDSYSWEYHARREASHQAYLERQARREASHQAYLERQARRERRHKEYLERQARREANRAAYFARITSNVQRFRAQYENILDNIRNQGLDAYIRDAFDEMTKKVGQLELLLGNEDVEAARDLSFEIGESIHGLLPAARREEQRIDRGEDRASEPERRNRRSEIQKQARLDFIEQMKRNLEADTSENPEAVHDAVQKLEELKHDAGALSSQDLQDRLVVESDRVDGQIADETVRREVIKAIYNSLKRAGFIVTAPLLTGDVVLLRARKPAGQQAEFSVKLDGGLTFKFDNYEGQKCREDVNAVTKLLDECYGVKLSNRTVLWGNPDRIQKGRRDNPIGRAENSMGQ